MHAALGQQWFSSSPIPGAAAVLQGSICPFKVPSTSSAAPLLPCFINLWRQPLINPSPNHCSSSKQIFSDMVLPKVNTCSATCSPHDGLSRRQPRSLPYRDYRNTLARIFSCALQSCSRLFLKVLRWCLAEQLMTRVPCRRAWPVSQYEFNSL